MIETSSDLPRRPSANFGSPWKSSTIVRNFGKCLATWPECSESRNQGKQIFCRLRDLPCRRDHPCGSWWRAQLPAGRSTYSAEHASMSPTSSMAYVSEKAYSFEFAMFFQSVVMVFFCNSYTHATNFVLPKPARHRSRRISTFGHFSTEFSFLVLEQPSLFVIRYVYKEHRFSLTIFLFFNYCLI